MLTCLASYGDDDVVLIRDSEIEDVLIDILNPILDVAGVSRKSVKIYVLGSKTVNAFATFDRTVFICAGLLFKAEKVEHIVGVLSHEIGHIACEHLIRHIGMAERSKILSGALMLLGIGAGMMAGSPDLVMGGVLGGIAMGTNTFLYHSRAEEEAADNKAMEFMQKLGLSSRGLLEITEIFALSARLNIGEKGLPNTHPDIEERVNYLRSNVDRYKQQTTRSGKIPDGIEERYKRIKVKLWAYSAPIEKVLAKYPKNDDSMETLYARAIALNRRGDFNGSITCINILISRFPKDPYLAETKAQILYENSRIAEAVMLYRRLVAMKKDDVLLNVTFANALVKSGDIASLNEAEKVLHNVLIKDRTELLAWRLLSIIYGRRNEYGESALMLAESALLRENKNEAIAQAKRAIKYGLKSPGQRQRAEYIAQVKTSNRKSKKPSSTDKNNVLSLTAAKL
ncbi:MAG: M48 family metalloprotease [Holosporales bacterium]|nr:M48 family metalloprotease [Holosporales bacterium]